MCVYVYIVCLVHEIKSIWESNIPIYSLQWNKRKNKQYNQQVKKKTIITKIKEQQQQFKPTHTHTHSKPYEAEVEVKQKQQK